MLGDCIKSYEEHFVLFFHFFCFLDVFDFLDGVHLKFFFEELEEVGETLHAFVVDFVSCFEEDDSRDFLETLNGFELLFFVHVEDRDFGLKSLAKFEFVKSRIKRN